MTLLTLVSKQIWPQVIAVALERPAVVVLLHTDDQPQSHRPAARLKEFLESEGLLTPDNVHLRLIQTTNLEETIESIGAAAEAFELGPDNCRLHLTGGTKLLTMAAVEWCRRTGNPSFYIEAHQNGQRVVRFHLEKSDLKQAPLEQVLPDITDPLSPLALLKCQLDAEDVTLDGQTLTLSEIGRHRPLSALPQLLEQARSRPLEKGLALLTPLLDLSGPSPKSRHGDLLELATAFAVLKSGPTRVQRGVVFKSRNRSNDRNDSGELDLVFNWKGRLWIVDCKDRIAADDRVDRLRSELFSSGNISSNADNLLKDLADELKDKELKTLKEDIAAVADGAGLLGKVLVVRQTQLPAQAEDYARTRKLGVVLANELHTRLSSLLSPK